MINTDNLENRQLILDIRSIVLRISMISHAPTQGLNLAPPPDNLPKVQRWRISNRKDAVPHIGSHSAFAAGTQVPRGRIEHKDDMAADFPQKSHLYFQHTITRWERSEHAYSASDLRDLLQQAEHALKAWNEHRK